MSRRTLSRDKWGSGTRSESFGLLFLGMANVNKLDGRWTNNAGGQIFMKLQVESPPISSIGTDNFLILWRHDVDDGDNKVQSNVQHVTSLAPELTHSHIDIMVYHMPTRHPCTLAINYQRVVLGMPLKFVTKGRRSLRLKRSQCWLRLSTQGAEPLLQPSMSSEAAAI